MNTFTLTGKILFEPENKTKKHINQDVWKKVAMVLFDGDVSEYYSWFLKKRYNLILNPPLRGSHVTFVNDSVRDLRLNGTRDEFEVETIWSDVKDRWNGVNLELTFNTSPRTNGDYWWLNVETESRKKLQDIRNELGLSKPFFGLHMTIGSPNIKNVQHSYYIWETIRSFELYNN